MTLPTGNSIIALGYIVACLSKDELRGMAEDETVLYRAVEIDAPNAQATIEHAVTGNQYRVTVEQISGEE